MIADYDIRRFEKHKENIVKVLEKDFQKSVLVELYEDVMDYSDLSGLVYVKVFVGEVSFAIDLSDAIWRTSDKLINKNLFGDDLCKCYTIKFVYKNIDKFELHGDHYYIRYADLISLLKGVS